MLRRVLILKRWRTKRGNFQGKRGGIVVRMLDVGIRRLGVWRVRRRRVVGCAGRGFWRGWSLSRWMGEGVSEGASCFQMERRLVCNGFLRYLFMEGK